MSSYTTEVRYICETAANLSDSVGYNNVKQIIEDTADKILDFDYPIFDEAYRHHLNTQIIRHFYTREICEETVGLWKLRMEQKMDEIMPYYNKLYLSEIDKINPYYNVDITTTRTINDTGDKIEQQNTDDNTATSYTDYSNKNKNINKNGSENENTRIDGNTTKTKGTQSQTTSQNNIDTNYTGKGENALKKKGDGSSAEKDIGEEHETTTNVQHNVDRYSDTPQGALNGMEAIDGNLYLTNARIDDNSSTTQRDRDYEDKKNKSYKDNETSTGTYKDNTTEKKKGTGQEVTKHSGSDTEKTNSVKNGNKNTNENTTGYETDTSTGSENKNRNINGQTKTNSQNLREYIEHVTGYKGNKSFAELILLFRKTLLNIDEMIMKDLEVCFFQLW